jgi:hypothetical protein
VLSLADLESVAALNVCLAAGQHEHSMPEEQTQFRQQTYSLWCCNEESVLIVDDQLQDGKLGYVTINCKALHLYI